MASSLGISLLLVILIRFLGVLLGCGDVVFIRLLSIYLMLETGVIDGFCENFLSFGA